MLVSLFSKIFKDEIGGRYPRAAPVVKTKRKDILSPIFYTAAPKCVFIRRLPRASHISRSCSKHRNDTVGQSASPARTVDIPWRSCSFRLSVSVADEKYRGLEHSFTDCFSGRFGPTCAHGFLFAFSLSSLELVC